MKFKYKILAINIILLSIAIGITGYLLVKKNFDLTLENQVNYALEESSLIQANMEYGLLDYINSSTYKQYTIAASIGKEMNNTLSANNVIFNIYYNDELCYHNFSDGTITIPDSLAEKTEYNTRYYSIEHEEKEYFIYTQYFVALKDNKISIVTKRNITNVYKLKDTEIRYLQFMLMLVLVIGTFIMYIICSLMTKPLAELNRVSEQFANGDYKSRSKVKGTDEIAMLSDKYNYMADSIEQHIGELNDMVKRREQFVADFTHEIKTPMTSIIGYADTIRSKELSRENQIMAADYIFSESKRLETMSMKLFDIIYLSNNEITLLPISAASLGTEILKSVTPALDKTGISITSSFDEATIYGDTFLLQSAFINLIDNAKKASTDGGGSNIEFTGTYDKDTQRYVYKVKDYGTGISEENIQNIYDEFFMVDKSRSRQSGGAGLGLSIVNMIISKHSAKIDISSTLGEFTEFTVTFFNIKEAATDE